MEILFVRKFVLVLLSIIFLFSCGNDDNPNTVQTVKNDYRSFSDIMDSLPTLRGKLCAHILTQPNGNIFYYVQGSYSGAIYKAADNRFKYVNGGVLTVCDTILHCDTLGNKLYGGGSGSSKTVPEFGKINKWACTGNVENNVPAFSTTMYSPEAIYFLSHHSNYSITVFKDETLHIAWNPDLLNKNGVSVTIASHKVGVESKLFLVDDIGYFDIDLSEVKDSSISIGLSRYNQKLIVADSFNFWIYALTSCSQSFKLREK